MISQRKIIRLIKLSFGFLLFVFIIKSIFHKSTPFEETRPESQRFVEEFPNDIEEAKNVDEEVKKPDNLQPPPALIDSKDSNEEDKKPDHFQPPPVDSKDSNEEDKKPDNFQPPPVDSKDAQEEDKKPDHLQPPPVDFKDAKEKDNNEDNLKPDVIDEFKPKKIETTVRKLDKEAEKVQPKVEKEIDSKENNVDEKLSIDLDSSKKNSEANEDFQKYVDELSKKHWNFDTNSQVDWHDYDAMKKDKERKGNGEQGDAFVFEGKYDTDKESLYYSQNGFNAYVSDFIALNRSVKDIRHAECSNQKYSSQLPTVSVIVPFINEHMSTLKRTYISVINRSPKSLLKEIILVDDKSVKEHLKKALEDDIANDPIAKDIVRIHRLPARGGLIRARQAGAKVARGDVLIFLDSHTEANYNWLPPLLDPIAKDYRTVVCPFIDVIDMNNFEYRAQDEGARGSFDWNLDYKRLNLLPKDLANPVKPFESPVMAGGLFAISAKFFWELEGYDEGLMIWGGEQYELSFKIWQCHGKMYDAPCSRVGHIYRKFAPTNNAGFGNYLSKNYRRVAEVWMDDYKEYLYKRRPDFRNVETGDLSQKKALRERLNCHPFKWFMENVAFDQPLNYPAIEPEDYAKGEIRNVQFSDYCVVPLGDKSKYGVTICDKKYGQKFVLDWHKDIKQFGDRHKCFDAPGGGKADVIQYPCHNGHGNQLWKYNHESQMILHYDTHRCLDMDGTSLELFITTCDKNSKSQKWAIEELFEDRLNAWSIDKI